MTLGGTYVACELVHSAILGHVVFLVRVILWKRQPHPLRQLPRRPLAHACPAACCWRPLLADRCQAAPRHKGKQDRRSRQRGTGALRPRPLGKKGRQGVPTGGCRPAGFASGQTCPLGGRSRKGSLSQVPGGPAHAPRAGRGNGRSKLTLMLSAKSSSALAPTVSMEVMRPGSLFLVLAAVP